MKKLTAAICLVSISMTSTAFGLDFVRVQQQVFAQSSSCDEVSSFLAEFSASPDRLVHENKMCKSDITDLLPPRIAGLVGTTVYEAGPNCFNTALVASGILSGIRHGDDLEIRYYLNPSLCSHMQGPGVGDIGYIGGLHAFVVLSKSFIFQKADQYATSPYTIARLDDTINGYRKYMNTPPNQNIVEYYHCNPDLAHAGTNPADSQLQQIQKNLQIFQDGFSSYLVANQPLSNDARSALLQAAQQTVDLVKQQPGIVKDNDSYSIANNIRYSLLSIYDNLAEPARPLLNTDSNFVQFVQNFTTQYSILKSMSFEYLN